MRVVEQRGRQFAPDITRRHCMGIPNGKRQVGEMLPGGLQVIGAHTGEDGMQTITVAPMVRVPE